MNVNPKVKKVISSLLVLCMVLQYVPMVSFATYEDNLCEHHTEHTAECSFHEDAQEFGCAYVCEICSAEELPASEPTEYTEATEAEAAAQPAEETVIQEEISQIPEEAAESVFAMSDEEDDPIGSGTPMVLPRCSMASPCLLRL